MQICVTIVGKALHNSIPCLQAKGAAKDVGKSLNPSSSNLPSPGAAADKASGSAKGLAGDAKRAGKNIASDLSENPLDGLADKVRASHLHESLGSVKKSTAAM